MRHRWNSPFSALIIRFWIEDFRLCRIFLWLDFFQEVMNAYAERYSDLVREISSVFFSSLQSDLSIGSFSLEQRLSFLQSAWNCYHVCCDRKLFSEKECKVFYGSLVMAVINLIVYASYDEDALFSVCSWSGF